jgi:hypothetical protein
VHKHHHRPIKDLGFSPWRYSPLSKQCLQQKPCEVQPIKTRPWIFILKGKIRNFTCVVAPTCILLLWNPKHQGNPSTVQRLKPPIASPPIRPSWYSPPLTSPWTKSRVMATKDRASHLSLQNQIVEIKA